MIGVGVVRTISYPRTQKTRSVMEQLTLSLLLLETDAPNMLLDGYQGQPNRSLRIAELFQVLCSMRPEQANKIADHL
ncbi:MAG: hypothetical protein G5663_07380 [Serratia symbiotica]|nr:hypothetical protein [Serratia symbiotica]